uniref:CD300 molecule like family member g n=1 Tax=Sus scrofa TaxID=9823 RepID=A0A8D1I3J9_PIG
MFPTEIHGLPEWCAQTLRGAWPGAWLRPPARVRDWEKRTEGTAEAPSGPALGRRGVTRAAPPLPSSSASPLEEVEAPRSAAVERSSQLPVCAPARPALTMRPLVLLWACLVLPGYGTLVGPKEISGFVGDTVSLQCTYGEALKTHRKYWCRKIGYLIARCSGTVFSGEYGQEGRVSVHDSPRELRFKVILRNLTLEDEGQYFCGIQRLGLDDSFSVSLHVFPGTTPHPATSPPAGISRPTTQLDSTSAKDTSLVRRSSTAKSGTSIPMTRILAPVLVLLALLLATGLATLGSWVLQRRKEAQLTAETERKEKLQLSHSPLESSWVPEYTAINPAGPTGPPASPNTEIRCLSQASEEDGACLRDPEGDVTPGPPLPVSREGPGLSEFISG